MAPSICEKAEYRIGPAPLTAAQAMHQSVASHIVVAKVVLAVEAEVVRDHAVEALEGAKEVVRDL